MMIMTVVKDRFAFKGLAKDVNPTKIVLGV
jgi:hypothetical protein